jgi:hypothetical protein
MEALFFFKTLYSPTVISICDSGVNNEFIDFDQFECLWSQYIYPVMGRKLLLEGTKIATFSLLKRTCD